jgi:hypothetical protein
MSVAASPHRDLVDAPFGECACDARSLAVSVLGRDLGLLIVLVLVLIGLLARSPGAMTIG